MSDNNDTTTPATPTNSPVVSDERMTGRVKWFNNKAGYGFITAVSGQTERVGQDVFVHHSAVKVEQEQYKYLVQGEYVDFSWTVSDSGKHKFQASNVRGVGNGKLICETRNEIRSVRDNGETSQHTSEGYNNERRTNNEHRVRGGGPREGEEWMLVRRKRTTGRPRNNYNRQNND